MLVKSLVVFHLPYGAALLHNFSEDLCRKLQRSKNVALVIRKYEHMSPAYANDNILSYTGRRILKFILTANIQVLIVALI